MTRCYFWNLTAHAEIHLNYVPRELLKENYHASIHLLRTHVYSYAFVFACYYSICCCFDYHTIRTRTQTKQIKKIASYGTFIRTVLRQASKCAGSFQLIWILWEICFGDISYVARFLLSYESRSSEPLLVMKDHLDANTPNNTMQKL